MGWPQDDAQMKTEGVFLEKSATYKTTRELLELAESLHYKLKRYYDRQKSSIVDGDAKLLLNYIRQNEKRFTEMISRYRRHAPAEVLDTFYQFTPDELKLIDEAATWQPDEAAHASQVLADALEVDDRMHAFYRRASEMAPYQPIRDMFASLAEAMTDKQRDEALNASQIRDI
jgi:hypothetical protein